MRELENENEFNDREFIEISQTLRVTVSLGVRDLWMAGATWGDIKNEFDLMLEETGFDEGFLIDDSKPSGAKKKKKPKKPL